MGNMPGPERKPNGEPTRLVAFFYRLGEHQVKQMLRKSGKYFQKE